MDLADERQRSSDVLVAELRADMVKRFGDVRVEIAEIKTYLIGFDGKNGLRGEMRALREDIATHVARDVKKSDEKSAAEGKRADRVLEDKKSRRILFAAVLAALLASPVVTRLVDQVFPQRIHAVETAEAKGPTVIQGEVK